MNTARPRAVLPRARRIPCLVLLVCVGVLSACERGPSAYQKAMADAENARRRGNYAKERRHFDEAAKYARKPNDAGEALYRSAQSWVRAGEPQTGAQRLEEFARQYPTSARAARALLDAGRAWEKARESENALRAYRLVVSKYPESGSALGAAKRIVGLEEQVRRRPPHESWRHLLDKNRSPEFDEALRYNYARTLEAVSKEQALLAYEDVAEKHPLPRASYSDEALLRAATLRRELGDASGALETLELLLAQGGSAAIVGSYTRSSYIEALMQKGLILRDNLGQPLRAIEAFQALPKKYPKSRLVDDALWECVRTEQARGAAACPRFQELRELRPESRYLRCEPLFCGKPMTDELDAQRCAAWLKMEHE